MAELNRLIKPMEIRENAATLEEIDALLTLNSNVTSLIALDTRLIHGNCSRSLWR